MPTSTPNANAGVHTSSGIEFQKHCALYMLFEKYSTLENRKYFICIEHYDDFMFCYQTQADLIESIEAYQAKKSSAVWATGANLADVLKKMTQVGLNLIADPHPKEPTYSHKLTFLTNNTIQLTCGKKTNKKTELINEGNTNVQYISLDAEIQQNILKLLRVASVTGAGQIGELNKLSLAYIDFPRKTVSQRDALIGQFNRIFGNRVNDSSAAVEVLLRLFRAVETTLNNGSIIALTDASKRVTSEDIKAAIKVITDEVKAYEFWRGSGKDLAPKLGIPVFQRSLFYEKIKNSFDLFKDLRQTEHRNLQNYVKNNKARWAAHVDEIACIEQIHDDYINENATVLSEQDVKAAICAAYIQIRD